MAIPRFLHRIWINDDGDDPMPIEFVGYGDRWRELHPGWDLYDWVRSKTIPMRNRHLFDRARQLVPYDWKRFQSDLVRLELLWFYGGLYVDTDVVPLKPIDPLMPESGALVGLSPNPSGPRGERPLTNAIVAAEPQHPWIDACIRRLASDVETYAGQALHRIAGPWLLTRALQDDPECATGNLTIVKPGVLYPQPIADRTAPVRDAYTTHLWVNTRDDRQGGLK